MRRRLIGPVLILLAAFLATAWIEDVSLYDPQPGPAARTLPPLP